MKNQFSCLFSSITANGKALAKKGHLEHKCSTLAPKFHSSTKVEFTTSSPFFANAMLVAAVTINLLGGGIKPTKNNMSVSIEMPKYKSHKEVWALKIKSIVRDGEGENRESDGSAIITPEEEGYAPFRVEGDYLHKHKPQVGGYYVVYKDGYKSFSPAEAFEEGNTRI